MRKRVTEGGDMTVTEPSCVVHFVRRYFVSRQLLLPGSWSLQLPVVETMEEHLGQVVHHLPLLGRQVVELVQDKVGHPLGDAWLLIRRIAQGSFNTRLGSLEDASSEEFEQVEVDLLGVLIFLLVDAHEQILHIHNNPQKSVQFIFCSIVEMTDVS